MARRSSSKPAPETPTESSPAGKRRLPAAWGRGLLVGALVVLLGGALLADWWRCFPDDARATFVGGKSCIECHQAEHAEWKGSFHDLAMDPATDQTVLGNFENAELTHFGLQSRMFRRDGKFVVHTEGPTGKFEDFEVKYVLGVAPLQQYMVEFDRPADALPGEIGRLQVLPICWDTGKKQWFFLQPPDVPERVLPDDDLHWTGVAQRWNNMCADCHVTNLQKNFDVARNEYRTTFTDLDVNCEACHGPGSLHVELARSKSLFWDRKRGYALAKLGGKDPRQARFEVETCAPCHSMRRIVAPGFQAGDNYYDYYVNELLQGHLYHADGQILEEVYELGSFTQSKMYHKGIRCSDCHHPHSVKTKHVGNEVCTSCHQHPAGKYDSPAHHHHDPAREGAKCVNCHMPTKTYMAVDPRLDHSLRVPRPDLSVSLGTPNACSGCHLEKSELAESKRTELGEYAKWLRAGRTDATIRDAVAKVDRWSADRFREWWGERRDADTHFSHALAAARRGDPDAASRLVSLAERSDLSAIVRATCLNELAQFDSAAAMRLAVDLLKNEEPLIRITAVAFLERLPDEELVRRLAPVLNDPIRGVRAEAGRVMSRVDERWLGGPERAAREKAIAEFRQGLEANSDRAMSHLGLGILAERQGRDAEAVAAYETALRIEPRTAGPRANLAALLERQLTENTDPAVAAAHSQRITALRNEELQLLARDARLLPDSGAIRYRYGLSLYLHGRLDEAEKELTAAVAASPQTPDFVLGLALLYQKQNRIPEAIRQTERLLQLRPNDPSYQQLLQELRASSPP